jgi:hypothetical protein
VISEALQTNKTLAELSSILTVDICFNAIHDEGALKIASALTVNSSLTKLGMIYFSDIKYNRIGKQGGIGLADALKVNKTLSYLSNFMTLTYARMKSILME